MNTKIRLFQITNRNATKAVRSDREVIFESGSAVYPAHIRSGSTQYNPKYDYVVSATLTQEMNRGGQLDLVVKKDFLEKIDDTRKYIEVTSPYILNTVHNNLASMQTYGCIWIGRQAKKTIRGDRVQIIYEGELAWLETSVIQPYTDTHDNIQFNDYLIAQYNNQSFWGVTRQSPYPWNLSYSTATHSLCDIGPVVERSNIYYSTIWKELNEKVLQKYNNQVLLRLNSNSTNNDFRRNFLVKPISSITRDYLDDENILSASHTINLAGRHAGIYAFGAQNDPTVEGDSTRWHGFAQSTGDASKITFNTYKSYVIGDYTDPTELAEKAAEFATLELSNTDSLDITLRPAKQESLNLGELYYINYFPARIDGEYRLMKRTVDLLNPAKNKLTFGHQQTITGR